MGVNDVFKIKQLSAGQDFWVIRNGEVLLESFVQISPVVKVAEKSITVSPGQTASIFVKDLDVRGAKVLLLDFYSSQNVTPDQSNSIDRCQVGISCDFYRSNTLIDLLRWDGSNSDVYFGEKVPLDTSKPVLYVGFFSIDCSNYESIDIQINVKNQTDQTGENYEITLNANIWISYLQGIPGSPAY